MHVQLRQTPGRLAPRARGQRGEGAGVSKNHGQWQAQGADIGGKGHCVPWGQESVPTKADGVSWLWDVAKMCTQSERERREGRACRAARRFVSRAPLTGYPSTMRSFYSLDDAYPDARIDVEIYGQAFRG
jgi:hypothetical protein